MGVWENPFSFLLFSNSYLVKNISLYLVFTIPQNSGTNTFYWVFMFHDNVVICMSLNKNLSFHWDIKGKIYCIIKAIPNGWYLSINFIQYDMASPPSPLRTQIKLVFGPMPTRFPRQTVSCPLLYTVPVLQTVRKPLTCKKRREEFVHICKCRGETWHKWI